MEYTPTWYGFRTQSQYAGGNRNVVHDIFSSSTRRHNARAGSIQSEFLHIRVPTDDHTTTTFFIESRFKAEGPYKRECRGFKKNERGVYQRVEDGWWGIASEDQDRAAQESQGLIHDRSREFLATSDKGVVMWRRLAFASIEAVEAGLDPHGIVREGVVEGAAEEAGSNLSAKNVIHFDAGKNFSDHDKSPVAAI